MSRSVRRPYAAITGVSSAKNDKRLAHRGERRAQNQVLHTTQDYDNLLMPHRVVCTWNSVWSWRRDGHQHLDDLASRWKAINKWRHHDAPEVFAEWYADQVRDVARLHRK